MSGLEQRAKSLGVDRIKLDALIVLGHNLGVGWKGEDIRRVSDHLSTHSKINILAAGILFKNGVADKIILSSGHTAGKEIESEAQAMKNFLKARFPEIPDESIILEEKSVDTAGNAEESIKVVNKEKFLDVGLISTKDHLKNASILFRNYGLEIKKENRFVAEEIVTKAMAKNPEVALKTYRESPQVRGDRLGRELIRSILLYTHIDSKGKILRLKSRMRSK